MGEMTVLPRPVTSVTGSKPVRNLLKSDVLPSKATARHASENPALPIALRFY